MRLNRKWILVIALVVSMVSAISGTLAYLTSTDTETNTFTVGNVSIDLQEPSYTGDNQNLLPGVVIPKDPQIVNTGRTDAWVWMEITLPTGLVDYIDWNEADWVMSEAAYGDTTVVTLKRETTLPAGETSAVAFTEVNLPATLTSMPAGLTSGTADIVVNAYAIQNKGFDTIEEAIAAYVPAGAKTAADAAELTAALAEGGEVYLTADINLADQQITVASGNTVKLNLNGHNLTGASEGDAHYAMFTIAGGGNLTVEGNGNVSATTQCTTDNRSLAIFMNNGNLTLNGGNYTITDSTTGHSMIIATIVDNRTGYTASPVTDASLTINGGTYAVAGNAKNLFRNYPQAGKTATLTINGGTFNANNGNTTYIWNQEAGSNLGELYFNGGTYADGVVYEDYNGQSDVHIAAGVTIPAYSGNN